MSDGTLGPRLSDSERRMPTPKPYTWRFTNRYGEEWAFEYDPSGGEGILRGSDVDWQEYRVIGGRAVGLILNEEEIQWLQKTWKEATSGV
jgi:hypothetical protein